MLAGIRLFACKCRIRKAGRQLQPVGVTLWPQQTLALVVLPSAAATDLRIISNRLRGEILATQPTASQRVEGGTLELWSLQIPASVGA